MEEETMRYWPASGVLSKYSCRNVLDSRFKDPDFTMRKYVLAVRQVDLKKTWPFSQRHLRLWLDRGKEPLLPPLDHPPPSTPFSSQVQLDCQPSERETISKEEEKATDLQFTSEKRITVLEPVPDIKLTKLGHLLNKKYIGTSNEKDFHAFRTTNITDFTAKQSKNPRQRKQASITKAGKRFFQRKSQRTVNKVNNRLLKVKGDSEGRMISTSVDSNKMDGLSDLVREEDTDWHVQCSSPKGSNTLGKHTLYTAESAYMCSRNATSDDYNVDIHSQQSASSLVTDHAVNLLRVNEENQGIITNHEGEISQAKCRLSTRECSQIRFDVEEGKCTSCMVEELISTSEDKFKHNKGLDISRRQRESKQKANRHEVTRGSSSVTEESLSTKSSGPKIRGKCVVDNIASILSDPLISKLCPVCRKFVSTSNTALNAHIDHCLTVGTLQGNSIRMQNYKPKQKIRSIADICAKIPAGTLDQKVTKNRSSFLSNCWFDLEDGHNPQKDRISKLKTCDMRRKLDSVKETSKRKPIKCDSEGRCELERNLKRTNSRPSIGTKRKKQTVLDYENHLKLESGKCTITSLSNSTSKVQNSETQTYTAVSLDNQYAQHEHIVAQPSTFPQVFSFTKKHRDCFRRRKKSLDKSHMFVNYFQGENVGLNMTDDFCQPFYNLSRNIGTYLPPAYNGSCIRAETSCLRSKNDGLQMSVGQVLSGDEASARKSTHVVTNIDEIVILSQDSKEERIRICTENAVSQVAETITALERILDSNFFEIVKSGESARSDLKETKTSNLSAECLPTDLDYKIEHLILKDFRTGGSKLVQEDQDGRYFPGWVTTKQALQKPCRYESELVDSSNSGYIYGTIKHDLQSNKKEMNQPLGNPGTLKFQEIPKWPELLRPAEEITSITNPYRNRSCLRPDAVHFEENNMLVSNGLIVDMNPHQTILEGKTSFTGIETPSESTQHKFLAHSVDSSHCLKIGGSQHVSLIGKGNIKGLTTPKLTGSSFISNQLMSEVKLSNKHCTLEVFGNDLAPPIENRLKYQVCEPIGEEPVKIIAEHNQELTLLHMRLPSLHYLDFYSKTGSKLGSIPSKPCSRIHRPSHSAARSDISASVNTINFAPGVISRAESWTAAVKMASKDTRVWNMPGGSSLQLDSSTLNRSISEPRPQNSGTYSRLSSLFENEDIPSALNNRLDIHPSLAQKTSHTLKSTHPLHEGLVKEGDCKDGTCHFPVKVQEHRNMDKSWTGKNFLENEENCRCNQNFQFSSIGAFSEGDNAGQKTSPPTCIQFSDISPRQHTGSCLIDEVKQLISSDQIYYSNVLMSSPEHQHHVPAESSTTESSLYQRTSQPAVIHIFGKPIHVLATEHEDVAYHANNQFEWIKHKKSACSKIAPLRTVTSEPLSAARITTATINMKFDKHSVEGSELCQNLGKVLTSDDVPLSELLSARPLPERLHEEKSQFRKLKLHSDGDVQFLDNCIQNPTGKRNLCAGNCQTQTQCRSIQLKECCTRRDTSCILPPPTNKNVEYDSSGFALHARESPFQSVVHPEVFSYCPAEVATSRQSKAIPMAVNSHSVRTGNRTTKASSTIASKVIGDHARKAVINEAKLSARSNVIVIDDDDENSISPITTSLIKYLGSPLE